MARTLSSQIEIAATPAEVWAVLADLPGYADWNPFVVEAAGNVVVGERLRVRIQPVGGRAMTFKPRVTAAEPARELAWLGSAGVRGLFDGAHRFELRPSATGTLLLQSEEFTGVLVPLVWRSMAAGSQAGFEQMNLALKRRVEARARAPRA